MARDFRWTLGMVLTALLGSGWGASGGDGGARKGDPKAETEPADAEAPLPEGWPGGTRPGAIEVKKYPAYRSAVVRKDDATADGDEVRMFFTLFGHIQSKGIKMTTPVVSTYAPEVIERPGAKGVVEMEFLYRRPDQGQAGPAAGAVKVEDHPAATYACLGVKGDMNGDMNPESTKAGLARLRAWLRDHDAEWAQAGPPRTLGYHGPGTPPDRRLFEVQVPVRPVDAKPKAKADPARPS